MTSAVSTFPDKELIFYGPFTEQKSQFVKVTNTSNKRICFKIKTTVPLRYAIQPNGGFLLPKEVTDIKVTLIAFSYDPGTEKGHKLSVDTVPVSDGDTDKSEVWKHAKQKDIKHHKLLCTLRLPQESMVHTTTTQSQVQQQGQQNEIDTVKLLREILSRLTTLEQRVAHIEGVVSDLPACIAAVRTSVMEQSLAMSSVHSDDDEYVDTVENGHDYEES